MDDMSMMMRKLVNGLVVQYSLAKSLLSHVPHRIDGQGYDEQSSSDQECCIQETCSCGFECFVELDNGFSIMVLGSSRTVIVIIPKPLLDQDSFIWTQGCRIGIEFEIQSSLTGALRNDNHTSTIG